MKKIILIIFLLIGIRLIYINLFMHEYYLNELYSKTNNYVYGGSAKRGRILDVNGNVLVDSIGVNTIYYHKLDVTMNEELEIAYKLADILSLEHGNIDMQKDLWLLQNNNGIDLLTDEEIKLYNERKLSNEDVLSIKYERIDLTSFTDIDKEVSYIYYLMNKDYTYDKKVIKEDVSDLEYAKIIESNIKGVTAEIIWERYYPYEDTLRSILGNIGYIPYDLESYYIDNGYNLNDTVGISYLELEYENYLRGSSAIYKVNDNGSLKLIKEEEAGSDIYLSIDINAQIKLEEIIKEELLNAKESSKTEYFNSVFTGISDPITGKIIAISGMRILDTNKDYYYEEITSDILTTTYTVGSVVKGATVAVGYNNDLIVPNKEILDSCVKLEFIPEKCSWKSLGYIDDVVALSRSSNYYQYKIAINLTAGEYHNNMKLNATEEHFDIYRDTLASFGLGTYSGIDLPGEVPGVIGDIVADDLLLNLSIGQYDTYTLLNLMSYSNTIANNKERLSLSLLDKVIKDNEVMYIHNNKMLSEGLITDEGYNQVIEGFKLAMISGTGYAYINKNYNPGGKTGTSESFIDLDNDGVIDQKTLSSTFIGFYPVDNPKYSIAIIAPHISYQEHEEDDYYYRITRYISKNITDYLF